VFAPGVGVRSTYHLGASAYKYMNGTSMATPHVAGAAALALSASPSASTSQLKWALLSSAERKAALTRKALTGARLNADAAVAALTGAGPDAVPTPEPSATPVPTATPEPVEPVATPTPAPPAPPAPVPTPAPAAPVFIPAPVEVAPALSDVKIGGSLVRKPGKLKVTFSLSRSATVRFTVARRGKAVASWTKRGVQGTNRVTLTRKLPTGRTLRAGAYTLAVGVSATAKSASIRVR
jgi:hypothetical protein